MITDASSSESGRTGRNRPGGSIFLGGSRVDPERYSQFLNKNAQEGWRVVTMEREIRRMLLVSSREAYLVILERER